MLYLPGPPETSIRLAVDDKWAVSRDGREIAIAHRQPKGWSVSLRGLPSRKVETTLPVLFKGVNGIGYASAQELLVAGDDGLWLVSRKSSKARRLSSIPTRQALVSTSVRGLRAFLVFSDAGLSWLQDDGHRTVRTPIVLDESPSGTDRESATVLPDGVVVFPNRKMKLLPGGTRLVPLSAPWPGLGIYDAFTNADPGGRRVFFRGNVAPEETTHFRWTSTDSFLENVRKPTVLRKIAFPENVRVYSAFLTDAGKIWYETWSSEEVKWIKSIEIKRI